MIRVGIIGYRNHAELISNLLVKSNRVEIQYFYHPEKKAGPQFTTDLKQLLNCDAVFILSPNSTHFEYLSYLNKNYSGYIFCEKPPVSSLSELNQLNCNPDKVFFNFQFRFSLLRDLIDKALTDGSLGKVLRAEAVVTHGLSFKPAYINSWRASKETHPMGVLETLGVHYLDLFLLLFGEGTVLNCTSQIKSGVGTAYDTSHLLLEHTNKVISTILVSYAAPRFERIEILGTNGVLIFEKGILKILSPRETFDKNGYFDTPPANFEFSLEKENWIEKAYEKSISYFLTACGNRKAFSPELYRTSIETNRIVVS